MPYKYGRLTLTLNWSTLLGYISTSCNNLGNLCLASVQFNFMAFSRHAIVLLVNVSLSVLDSVISSKITVKTSINS